MVSLLNEDENLEMAVDYRALKKMTKKGKVRIPRTGEMCGQIR